MWTVFITMIRQAIGWNQHKSCKTFLPSLFCILGRYGGRKWTDIWSHSPWLDLQCLIDVASGCSLDQTHLSENTWMPGSCRWKAVCGPHGYSRGHSALCGQRQHESRVWEWSGQSLKLGWSSAAHQRGECVVCHGFLTGISEMRLGCCMCWDHWARSGAFLHLLTMQVEKHLCKDYNVVLIPCKIWG